MINNAQGNVENTKTFLKIIAGYFLVISVAWFFYANFGHEVIRAIYEGRSVGILNLVITGQDVQPVEFYLEASDSLYLWAHLYVFATFLACLFVATKKQKCESIRNKLIWFFSVFFFFCIVLTYISNLYIHAASCHGWVVADWLINYQGGFVRRGLSGYVLVFLSDFIRIKPNFIVLLTQVTLYLSYMGMLFLVLCKKKVNLLFLILLLSPATLRFSIIDPTASGRKEILLFFLFALYTVCLNRKKMTSNLAILFSLALFIATLCHELVFFYTPYFLIAAYLQSKMDKDRFDLPKSLLVISGSFLALVALVLFGRAIDGAIITSGLIERGLCDNIGLGILSWSENFGPKDIFLRAVKHGWFWLYGGALFLGLAPFFAYLKFSRCHAVTLKKFGIVFLGLFLFSLPLFVLAIDWGRWLNIHFMLLLFAATLLLEDSSCDDHVGGQSEEFLIPCLRKTREDLSYKIRNAVFLMVTFFYLFFWQMPHCEVFPLFTLNIR